MRTNSQRGAALILALMILSLIAVLGGGLLTSITLDVWVSENYKTGIQALYLAEGGIEEARVELLRSGLTLTSLLSMNAGQPFISGNDGVGQYQVWLSNDVVDGPTSTVDTNQIVKLLSFAEVGNSRKSIEATVGKSVFPNDIDLRLQQVSGLERTVQAIVANADDVYTTAVIGNYGSATDYRVGVVNGDCTLGPGTGYGFLLVRGELTMSNNVAWSGMIVVIGQGVIRWSPGTNGQIVGGVFVARTHDMDGVTLLQSPGVTTVEMPSGVVLPDAAAISKANASFPFTPIAVREF